MAKTTVTVVKSDLSDEVIPEGKAAQIRVTVGETVRTLDISTDELAGLKLAGKGRQSKRAGRKAANGQAAAAS